jgi:tRNA dihydrouridine synthase A
MSEQLFVKVLLALMLVESTCAFFYLASSSVQVAPLQASRSNEVSTSHDHDHALQFHVAPMQCYTNAPLRYLYRALSADAVLWTEMEKIEDLMAADASALQRRFGAPGYKDSVLQVGGNDVPQMRACIQRLSNHGYQFDEVNLNCGCPSIESGGAASYGASLMKQPQLTHELLEAIRLSVDEDTTVSLKCRVGVFDTPEEMELARFSEAQQYQSLHNYIAHAQRAGIAHLILHARPAVLSGLSPTKNRQVPALDYHVVEEAAKDFGGAIKVTLNGGINNMEQLSRIHSVHIPHIHSYMAGRWMLRRPLDLARVGFECDSSNSIAAESGCSPRSTAPQQEHTSRSTTTTFQAVEQYVDYVKENMYSSNTASVPTLADLCLPLYLITKQLREDYNNNEYAVVDSGSTCCRLLLPEKDIESIYDLLRETTEWLYDSTGTRLKKRASVDFIEFKKISDSFKGLVGTKVANKWKRNRAEL